MHDMQNYTLQWTKYHSFGTEILICLKLQFLDWAEHILSVVTFLGVFESLMFAEISTNNTIPEPTSCMEEYSEKELTMSISSGVTKNAYVWNRSWENRFQKAFIK